MALWVIIREIRQEQPVVWNFLFCYRPIVVGSLKEEKDLIG